MVTLADLPPELIEGIISSMTAEGTSSHNYLFEEPRASRLLLGSRSLKHFSQTCRSFRCLAFPHLFSCLKTSIEEINILIDFSRGHHLRGKVESLVVHASSTRSREGTLYDPIWLSIVALIDTIEPSTVTFVLPPAMFQNLVTYNMDLTEEWAFRIPCQVLRLKNHHKAARSTTAAAATDLKPNIFNLRPWSHAAFNEGCSVRAYSTYEHYRRRTPSLICHRSGLDAYLPNHSFATITSFDFVAVFPIVHIDKFSDFWSLFPNLQCLRTQLAPSSMNQILDDQCALGQCSRSDLWAEFCDAYSYLVEGIVGRQHGWFKSLRQWTILDYALPGRQIVIDEIINNCSQPLGKYDWCHDGGALTIWIDHSRVSSILFSLTHQPSSFNLGQ